ncbi:hypothetical protein [Bacillus sp. ISL-45]|uniref:hypothetical protein n=1 Tax=Bacillus sp. ISL-45 TaxID=2819128 RepID=UPI001BE9293C|nr:hypothetical protein [Bacillus sp. ISL-45]MBT2661641.1 hypothetical protein [Bacillus sp. ISL-45]
MELEHQITESETDKARAFIGNKADVYFKKWGFTEDMQTCRLNLLKEFHGTGQRLYLAVRGWVTERCTRKLSFIF